MAVCGVVTRQQPGSRETMKEMTNHKLKNVYLFHNKGSSPGVVRLHLTLAPAATGTKHRRGWW
jgi:hypothetical protein